MTKSAKLRSILAQGSKSFSLASRLLSTERRDDAAAVYAFCRRCDDAIDNTPQYRTSAALTQLSDELDAIYAGKSLDDLVLTAFQEVVRRRRIPREYPSDLMAGMAMDVTGTRYRNLAELSLYGYRVAGTVGLMMCHVLGVRNDAALAHAVDLGIALQLTNIARDVAEDWSRARLYLPDDHLGADVADAMHQALGGPRPENWNGALARATMQVVQEAEDYYRSGDAGLLWLSLRDSTSIRSARYVYWGIGQHVGAGQGDPRRGRAVVPISEKLLLVARALGLELVSMRARFGTKHHLHVPGSIFRFGSAGPLARPTGCFAHDVKA